MDSSIVGLLNNAALLIVAGFVFDLMGEYSLVRKPSLRQISIGVMLGVIGTAVMLTPWELIPGLIFDARSILLGISGLFFGTVPTLIVIAFTVVTRLVIGGTGLFPGIAVIITSGLIGLLWRHSRRKTLWDISPRELYVFGIVLHLNMLGWMLTLPPDVAVTVLQKVALPVMLIHPLGTALLGQLLANRLVQKRTEEALLASEHKMRMMADTLPAYVSLVRAEDLRYEFVNSKFIDLFGKPREEIIGARMDDIVGQDNYQTAHPYLTTALSGKAISYETALSGNNGARWVSVNYVPDINEEGEVVSVVILGYDITERRKFEEDLREKEQLLRTISENFPNSYLSVIEKDFIVGYTAGQEFRKQDLDPALFIGFTLEQVFGENADLVRGYYQKTFEGKEQTFELFISGQYQRYKTVPFFAKNGSVSRILAVSENITEQVKAAKKVRESEKRYRMLFERASDAIFLVDVETGFYLDGNRAAEELTGFPTEKLREKTIANITPQAAERLENINKEQVGSTVDMGEVIYLRADGTERITLLNTVLIEPGLIFGLAHDITEQKKAEAVIRDANEKLRIQLAEIRELEGALREQAIRDPLTGLFNRRYMEEALEQALANARRKQEPLSLVLLDLDHLKELNEEYGHFDGGDKALQVLAHSIQRLCRAGDTFCRYAGDEFVVILTNTNLDVAYQRALEWKKAISAVKVNGSFTVSFSAGVSEYPSHGDTANSLLKYADEALFEAKDQGRNQVVLCYQK